MKISIIDILKVTFCPINTVEWSVLQDFRGSFIFHMVISLSVIQCVDATQKG